MPFFQSYRPLKLEEGPGKGGTVWLEVPVSNCVCWSADL